MDPNKAFDRITNTLGFRPIAVSLYRVITSPNPIIVVENDKQVEWFKVFLQDMQDSIPLSALRRGEQQRKMYRVISMETYKAKWQEFAGREICLVEEEGAAKNPGVDLMMETIIKEHARDVLKQYEQDTVSDYLTEIKQILQRVMHAVQNIRESTASNAIGGNELEESEILRLLNTNLEEEIEKNLGFHLIQTVSHA